MMQPFQALLEALLGQGEASQLGLRPWEEEEVRWGRGLTNRAGG
jgi:hypothetical protein